MTQHDPNRVHWAVTLRIITENKSLSRLEILEKLKVDKTSSDKPEILEEELDKALDQLLQSKKIRKAIGMGKVVYMVPYERESRRNIKED